MSKKIRLFILAIALFITACKPLDAAITKVWDKPAGNGDGVCSGLVC